MINLTVEKVKKITDIVLIALFVMGISLPLADNLLNFDPIPPIDENRKLRPFPPLKMIETSIPKYLKNFEAFFNDQFGFRGGLIQGRSLLMVNLLGISSSPKVIIGQDNWLFMGNQAMVDYYRAKNLFAPEKLAHGQRLIESDRDALVKQGIHYLVVIVPNKNTIYPEFMPDEITQLNGERRADQLFAYLNNNSDVDILYLKDALLQAKTQGFLYYKTDSHWNGQGAFVGYQEIMKPLTVWFPQLQPISASNLKIVKEGVNVFPLTKMLGLGNIDQEHFIYMKSDKPKLARKVASTASIPEDLLLNQRPLVMEVDNDTLPSAVVFHDSFISSFLKSTLAEHFQRTAFFHTAYYTDYDDIRSILEREQPDVVIYQFVERKLQLDVEPDVAIVGLRIDQSALITAAQAGNREQVLESDPNKASATEVTYVFLDNLDKADITIPEVNFEPVKQVEFVINGERRLVFFEHPNSEVVFKNVLIDEMVRLTFGLGINQQAWDKPGDGVLFEIDIIDEDGVQTNLFSQYIDPKNNPADRHWFDHEYDLAAYVGQTVSIIFRTSDGPKGNFHSDWAGWSYPQLRVKGSDTF